MGVTPPTGVLITGVYGVGKTSLADEIAHLLEAQHAAYAAIDLDWLCWFDTAADLDADEVFRANLAAVVGIYVSAGVERFVMAYAVRDEEELDAMRAVLPFDPAVVRLTAPATTIAARLRREPTTSREHDLQVAREWLDAGTGAEIGELVLNARRPLPELATRVLTWLGWS